ncbi:Uncharacterized conserved protein, DUF1800 family [Duganella sacchari]|uniref:Uncharacterized conserved protein, DUF1800 family n=1 Tax=Duganella sacchari TaxID=551987 RepID=A0A1M7RCP5_9BURK|nr:DUF1800 domain-containing protein [Duganella sacchari]SHN43909.1 Uncharacterized conserved protein, DUF1800 family [Duganella sacchari]
MKLGNVKLALATASLITLAACGGSNPDAVAPDAASSGTTASRMIMGGATTAATADVSITPAQASRFLAQASFGPTEKSIAEVAAMGQDAWITAQFAKPRVSHLTTLNGLAGTIGGAANLTPNNFLESFWKQAISGDDQLRQRVTYALSQIFVISTQQDAIYTFPRGVANYYDLLAKNAFGNFRDLLQDVATNPMMGLYLSHLRNEKESATRMPDENFAREIMQLMTIGLYELQQDGVMKLANGKPIETYTHDDVMGLAKVFTGWCWNGADKSEARYYGTLRDPFRETMPMQVYAQFHSTSEKRFLGRTIGAGSNAADDMKIALDTLFNHRNVGPFIARRLIERLVTSNPSPSYVSRVAMAFNNNGQGVRGDMQAVIRAILMAPEARWGNVPGLTASPKVREPVIRLANWMRAFNVTSKTGRFLMFNTDNPVVYLAQTPMNSPSVFNFYRPGYVPPNSDLALKNLTAPELQIASEPSVIGYVNFMRYVVTWGTGGASGMPDIVPDYSAERALAYQPEALVDRIKLLVLNGNMSTTLRNQILSALKSISEPNPNNAADVAVFRDSRVSLAIFLAMVSPEYIVQK